MKTVFADKNDFIIEDDDEDVAIAFILRAIKEVYPWAAEIVKVKGKVVFDTLFKLEYRRDGWMVFESAADAEVWKNEQ